LRVGVAWFNGVLGWIGSALLLLALLGVNVVLSLTIGSWSTFFVVILALLMLCLGEGAYRLQLEVPPVAVAGKPEADAAAAPSLVIEELVVYGDINSPLIVKIAGPGNGPAEVVFGKVDGPDVAVVDVTDGPDVAVADEGEDTKTTGKAEPEAPSPRP
jgi:hypothetical protein